MIRKYEKYKDSGVEWIGEIPEGWEIKKLKYIILNLESGVSVNATDFPANGEDSGVLKTSCVYEYKFDARENKAIWESEIPRAKVNPRKGSIVISRMNTPDLVGASGYVDVDHPNLFLPDRLWQTVFHPHVEIDAKWLSYAFISNGFRKILSVTATGTSPSMKNLGQEQFTNISIPFLRITEQSAIASFLDRKTSEIDQLITRKEKLIALYEEEKSAIINHAVTKGLDSKVKTKPSGIEWLGDIPAHWEVKRLKWLLSDKLKYGANESAEFEDINWPRYIRITDFGDDGKLRSETFKSLPYEIAKEYLLESGDILFARSGATVGKTFQFKHYEGLACFAGYLIKAKPKADVLLSDFLYLFTKSGSYDSWKNSIFNQATIQNIGADKYAFLEISLPSISEQTAIVTHIETECSRLDSIIEKFKKQIELFKEYRTTLISEVVTGKIDVRNEVTA